MKTEQQVREKLKEHEDYINNELKSNFPFAARLVNLRQGRQALLWVLSNQEKIEPDELTIKIDFEIQCIESTKIF